MHMTDIHTHTNTHTEEKVTSDKNIINLNRKILMDKTVAIMSEKLSKMHFAICLSMTNKV